MPLPATAIVVAATAAAIILLLSYWKERHTSTRLTVLNGGTFVSATAAAMLGRPVVFRNVQSGWKAQAWTPTLLSAQIPMLVDVAVLQQPRYSYQETVGKPLRPAALPQDDRDNINSSSSSSSSSNIDNDNYNNNNAAALPPQPLSRMSTSEFWDRCRAGEYLWHSSSLLSDTNDNHSNGGSGGDAGDDGADSSASAHTQRAVEEAVAPIANFIVGRRMRLSSVNTWFGCDNVTTRLHHDMSHNVFLQIFGSKRFVLHNPLPGQPAHRPFTSPHYVHTANPAVEQKVIAAGIEVVLHAGDLLVIPPLWYHEVTAMGESISINVWSRSVIEDRLDEMLYRIALPFEAAWDRELTVVAALVFLRDVLANDDDNDDNDEYDNAHGDRGLHRWAANRWGGGVSRPAVRSAQASADSQGILVAGAPLRAKFARQARRVQRVAHGERADGDGDGGVICASHGQACTAGYAKILLRDYADSVLTFACGPGSDEVQVADTLASWLARGSSSTAGDRSNDVMRGGL